MGFEDRHPAVNLIFFTAVIAGTILFHHPVYLGISVVCALAYSIYRGGRRAAVFDLCVLVCAGVFCLYYSTFHHFGITELGRNPVGNRVTLESVVYGMVLGLTAAGVVMWMSCVYSVVSSDKVVYLFGRVSPPGSAGAVGAAADGSPAQGSCQAAEPCQTGRGQRCLHRRLFPQSQKRHLHLLDAADMAH